MFKKLALSALIAALSFSANADVLTLKEGHPDKHIVEKGDTLWDISSKFLENPWVWPKIWKVNPQIENPHLIYPGDIVYLKYDESGNPILVVERDHALDDVDGKKVTRDIKLKPGQKLGDALKLSPEARVVAEENVILPIPARRLLPFLTNNVGVVSTDELNNSPYIIGERDGRLIISPGDKVYVKGDVSGLRNDSYGIYRESVEYTDPITGESLGHQVNYLGQAFLMSVGEPNTFGVGRTKKEILKYDRLAPINKEDTIYDYIPTESDVYVEGHIVSIMDRVALGSPTDIIVLNIGKESGLKHGDLITLWKAGDVVNDKFQSEKDSEQAYQLPSEKSGKAMIVGMFDKVSYAIVLKTKYAVKRADRFTTR